MPPQTVAMLTSSALANLDAAVAKVKSDAGKAVTDANAATQALRIEQEANNAKVRQALAATAQAAAQAVDLGRQALEQAGRIPVATFAELDLNHANAPLGTWGYTADTRITYRKEAAGADGWVQHGEGAAPMSAVEDKQPALAGVADYARTPSPDIVNNAPVRGPEVLDMSRKLRVYGSPYGQYDNSTMFAVFANPERMPAADPTRPPRSTVAGYGTREELSGYLGRDSVGGFVGAYARKPQESTAEQTTYTATSVYAPGVDLSKLVYGMVVDTRHGPDEKLHRWSGFVQSVDTATQTIVVDKWTRNIPGKPIEQDGTLWPNVETGVPANGVSCYINSETQVFSLNTMLWVAADAQANHGTGCEIDVMNYKRHYDPADPSETRVELDGLNVVASGGTTAKRGRYAVTTNGQWFASYVSFGAFNTGFLVEKAVAQKFTGATGVPPANGFHDASDSNIAFLASSKHIFAFRAEGETTGPSFIADAKSPVAYQVGQQAGVGLFRPAAGNLYRSGPSGNADLEVQESGLVINRMNQSMFISIPAENGVLRMRWNGPEHLLLLEDGDVRARGYQVGDKQVLGPRQPTVRKSDGTAADNQRAINELIDRLIAHGGIEPN